VVASWDYHRGAKIRGSVRGNPGRFSLQLPATRGAFGIALAMAVLV
jgi:hypothetical protein